MLDRTFVVFIAIPNHHHSFDAQFRADQGAHRQQSMIDGSQRRPRRDHDRKSSAASDVEHQFRIVDGDENAARAFRDHGPAQIAWRLNAVEIDSDAAYFRGQVRR